MIVRMEEVVGFWACFMDTPCRFSPPEVQVDFLFFEVDMEKISRTRKITLIGMLSALAYLFTLIGHFVPITFGDFLRYDPKDAIIVMAGFSVGPLAALIISVIVSFLELITISTTGIIGFFMNVISSASFACVSALIYKKIKKVSGAVIGLTVSSLVTVALMLLWNYIVTPFYMDVPRSVIASMLLPVFLPFNVIKCGLNSALVMIIYKPFVTAMRGAGFIGRPKGDKAMRFNPLVLIFSLALMAVMIALFIILK